MKKQLNIDGVYFRVKRMGKYCNVCFSDLENSEMDEYLEDLDKEALQRLVKNLGNKLYDICDQFGIESEEVR